MNIAIDYTNDVVRNFFSLTSAEFISKPLQAGGQISINIDRFKLIDTPTKRPTHENPTPFIPSNQMMHAISDHTKEKGEEGADGHMLEYFIKNPESIPPSFFGPDDESHTLIFFPQASTIMRRVDKVTIPGHYEKVNAGTKEEKSIYVPEKTFDQTITEKVAYALVKRKDCYVWQRFVFEKDGQSIGGFGIECKWLFLTN